ncbi:hypothetical protein KTE45_05735 [Burkholderia multivorans]|uniref:hypothetical protein n=1 Tax=Burkholderia multivorans TaxID=87883 RepID=UPI001C21EBA0|nr:hypothetical protein [Burkholderia multivorans]MBU9441729.1 hypothetical protein [Burkholderia multivorans]MBU9517969.1 hypothetical protein [Burkholderia multivorans]MCA8315972.1 hypothetical protein [Burkholderia multivorans]MCO8647606.1 hypothetical protein [Burkholderia multivorans]
MRELNANEISAVAGAGLIGTVGGTVAGSIAGAAVGPEVGAGIGAAVGSVVPGIGTVGGAIVGAGIGSVYGAMVGGASGAYILSKIQDEGWAFFFGPSYRPRFEDMWGLSDWIESHP